MEIIMNDAKDVEVEPLKEINMQCKPEVERALEKNNEEWQKRMLLLVMIMIIAILGID